MKNVDRTGFIRTTIYLPKDLHVQSKMMALITNTNLSNFIRVSLSEKIKQIKEKARNENTNKS